jgi:hypothetical protein
LETKNQILIYSSNDRANLKIDVRLEDDTVWLTQAQMATLFDTTRNNITIHIANIFNEEELVEQSVCKDSLLTAKDGKNYKTKFYNLDVIISVGYRVKSLRGTQFRIWANKILKEYLLKGYSVNHRLDMVEKNVHQINNKLHEIDFQIRTNLPQNEGIFFDGQIFDAYKFVVDLIKSAATSIVLVDNYCDDSVLLMLSKRSKNVKAEIYTSKISRQLKLDLDKFNQQYEEIKINLYKKSHDRILIIDQKDVYHIGASLKDLGKKWFAFSKINIDAKELIDKLQN